MITIGIDPGARYFGAAIGRENKLVAATVFRGHEDNVGPVLIEQFALWVFRQVGTGSREFIGELPKVYSAGQQKGDQNDLIRVAYSLGVVLSTGRAGVDSIQLVSPREWKGTVEGEAMITRILGRLSDEERKTIDVDRSADKEHAVDAAGLILWKWGRLDRRRVFAGVNG